MPVQPQQYPHNTSFALPGEVLSAKSEFDFIKTDMTHAGARKLGLAWLDALYRGEDARERLLNALQRYKPINQEPYAAMQESMNRLAAHQFFTLADNLEQEENIFFPLSHHGQQRFTDWLFGLADSINSDPLAQGRQHSRYLLELTQSKDEGYYWLQSGNLQLMLAIRHKGIHWQYDLYDPLMGWEARCSGYDENKIITTISNTLNVWLNSTHTAWKSQSMASHYGVLQQNSQFVFDIRELNPARLFAMPALNELHAFLESGVINTRMQQEIIDEQLLPPAIPDIDDSVTRLAEQSTAVLNCMTVKITATNENIIECIGIPGWQLSGSSINWLIETMADVAFDEQNTLPPLPATLYPAVNHCWVATESR